MATDTSGRKGTLANPEVYDDVPFHLNPWDFFRFEDRFFFTLRFAT